MRTQIGSEGQGLREPRIDRPEADNGASPYAGCDVAENRGSRQSTFSDNVAASSLFWKALGGLLVFDVFGFGDNFVRLHCFIRNWRVSSKRVTTGTVGQVCNAVNHACVWYPKRVRCLQRSAITTCLMRHCGVQASMVLGVQALPFRAHAWTEVKGRPVNERREVQNHYKIMERF